MRRAIARLSRCGSTLVQGSAIATTDRNAELLHNGQRIRCELVRLRPIVLRYQHCAFLRTDRRQRRGELGPAVEGIGSPARLGLHPLGDNRQTFGLPTPAAGYMAVDGTSVEAAFRRRNRSGPTMVARMMRSISVPAGRSKTSDTPWFS